MLKLRDKRQCQDNKAFIIKVINRNYYVFHPMIS